ncbi:MAG: HNH endonuclease family protein [Patescibacteria group bacterium]
MGSYRLRRVIAVLVLLIIAAVPLSKTALELPTLEEVIASNRDDSSDVPASLAVLEVKGRAPKTGYERSEFGNGWSSSAGCDTRNRILARDLTDIISYDGCKVDQGTLDDPYTGTTMAFVRGETTSDDVQIDHVVALSNAWQTGAQQLSYERRVIFSNDPLNLMAVSGPANEQKSDSDAATWLPANKSFRCTYINRQVSVKAKYDLWVTVAERDAMARVLDSCKTTA